MRPEVTLSLLIGKEAHPGSAYFSLAKRRNMPFLER